MFVWIHITVVAFLWGVHGDNLCTESMYGTEFIFGFMDLPFYTTSNTFTDASISIRVSSKRSTNVYVTLSSTDSASKNPTWDTKRQYVYRSTEISFNSSFINKYQSDDAGSSIRIKSSQPVAVLAVYKASEYVVATPVLPMSTLSTQYVLPSYTRNTASHSVTQILLVALNDSTVVRLNSYDTSRTITLNQNETYVYQASQDLSGMSVTSNNPVAVFTSVTKGYSYYSSGQRPSEHITNFLAMQASPFSKAAVHFIVPALPGEVKTYKVRMYASSEGARVEIHSTSDSTKHMHIYERIYYEYTTKGSSTLEILSDKPIIVVQIAIDSHGSSMFMTNVPAVSQYLSYYLTDTALQRSSSTSYIVTIPYEEALGLLVNEKPILHNPEVVSHRTPLGNYTIFTIPATYRDAVSHVGDEPFGLLIYERSTSLTINSISGHPAGMQFKTDCQMTTAPSQIIG